MSDPIRQLARQFRAIAREATDRATNAINNGLPYLERAMKREVPVLTGELNASIYAIPSARKRDPYGQVRAGSLHAAAVDLGTHYTHANDFVDRAVDHEGPRMIQRAANDFLKGI